MSINKNTILITDTYRNRCHSLIKAVCRAIVWSSNLEPTFTPYLLLWCFIAY